MGSEVSSVGSEELLARFLFYRSHLRSDGTVKPDAFIPYPYPDLSVTRHRTWTEAQIWAVGHDISRQSGRNLAGRADVRAAAFQFHQLRVILDSVAGNPNHAIVTEWPVEKSAQKSIAQEISVAAGRAKEPPGDPDTIIG